jgi:hypothetical protein
MALKLSSSRPRQLQYSAAGLRRDLRLLEVDDALLGAITGGGCEANGLPLLSQLHSSGSRC